MMVVVCLVSRLWYALTSTASPLGVVQGNVRGIPVQMRADDLPAPRALRMSYPEDAAVHR